MNECHCSQGGRVHARDELGNGSKKLRILEKGGEAEARKEEQQKGGAKGRFHAPRKKKVENISKLSS